MLRTFLAELARRDRLLTVAGWGFLVLLAGMMVPALFDHRTVLGLNVWIKPSKFALSIAIYLWTLAWLLGELPGPAWAKGFVRWGATVAMVAEMICLVTQSARGVASHFNHATPFDAAVFSTMGLFILFNTMLEAFVLAMFFQRSVDLRPAYLWGIRLGLIGALLSAGVGGEMLRNGGHAVGVADGGPGLPVVNWSTNAGDLRVAHAVGLHALQVLVVAGYVLSHVAAPRVAVVGIFVVALVYFGVGLWLYVEAMEGLPLIAEKPPALAICAAACRLAC